VVTTWMGDCLQTSKLSRYVTNTKVNSAFHLFMCRCSDVQYTEDTLLRVSDVLRQLSTDAQISSSSVQLQLLASLAAVLHASSPDSGLTILYICLSICLSLHLFPSVCLCLSLSRSVCLYLLHASSPVSSALSVCFSVEVKGLKFV